MPVDYFAGLTLARMVRLMGGALPSENNMPEHVLTDLSLDGYFARRSALDALLEEKCGLQEDEVNAAFSSANPQTKEKLAARLRAELGRLRTLQSKGDHPVRRGQTLSLPEIADAAFTMLEAGPAISNQLLSLLQELLNVDRHRRSLAEDLERLELAATFLAQKRLDGHHCGVREMALAASISVSTASQWIRSREFQALVSLQVLALRGRIHDWFTLIKLRFPEITGRRAFWLAMRVDSLSGDELEPDSLVSVVDHLRTVFEKGPISVQFLPAHNLRGILPKDILQQQAVVLEEVIKLIGDPAELSPECVRQQLLILEEEIRTYKDRIRNR